MPHLARLIVTYLKARQFISLSLVITILALHGVGIPLMFGGQGSNAGLT